MIVNCPNCEYEATLNEVSGFREYGYICHNCELIGAFCSTDLLAAESFLNSKRFLHGKKKYNLMKTDNGPPFGFEAKT